MGMISSTKIYILIRVRDGVQGTLKEILLKAFPTSKIECLVTTNPKIKTLIGRKLKRQKIVERMNSLLVLQV